MSQHKIKKTLTLTIFLSLIFPQMPPLKMPTIDFGPIGIKRAKERVQTSTQAEAHANTGNGSESTGSGVETGLARAETQVTTRANEEVTIHHEVEVVPENSGTATASVKIEEKNKQSAISPVREILLRLFRR